MTRAYPATARPDLVKVNQVSGSHLVAWKRPKRYVPVADWPVNESDKVDRKRLLALLIDLTEACGDGGANLRPEN